MDRFGPRLDQQSQREGDSDSARARTAAILAGVGTAVAISAGAGAATYAVLSDDGQSSIGSIYDHTQRGVVEINVTETTKPPLSHEQRRGQGSGWVYDDEGHIVTIGHVVAGARTASVRLTFSVRFWNGASYPATVVGSNDSADLAVLKVDAPSSLLHPLRLGNSDALHVGDLAVAIGSPFGLEGTVTSGIVSALNRELKTETNDITDLIQTDAAINHGNSGSPLLNAEGKVVGINGVQAQIDRDSLGSDGVAFAIPSNTVVTVVPRLISNR